MSDQAYGQFYHIVDAACVAEDLDQTDRAADQILAELSECEIRAAQRVMNRLLLGVQENRFRLRSELVHSILVCSLLLARHSCRRLLEQ